MFTPTCPVPIATKFYPLKTPPTEKSPSSNVKLPQPKSLTYTSHRDGSSSNQLIGPFAKAETVPEPDEEAEQLIDLPAKVKPCMPRTTLQVNSTVTLCRSSHCGSLRKTYCTTILYRTIRLCRSSLHHLPPQRMTLPEHVKHSIYLRYPTLSLLPSHSFGPLPLSNVGTPSPGAFGGLEQLMVEGRLGVLHHN